MSYTIRRAGHPILETKCAAVEIFGRPMHRLARALWRTMRELKGVGLAAPQIGKAVRVAVVQAGGFRAVLVNPRILDRSGEQIDKEGCLSVPESRWRPLRRAAAVRVRWQDEEGREHEAHVQGFAARAVQHEVDHLDGVLITER